MPLCIVVVPAEELEPVLSLRSPRELVLPPVVIFAKRDGKEAVNSFSKVLATEAPGITLNSREVFRMDPLLPIEGPESSSILDIRLLEWMFDKLKHEREKMNECE